MKRYDLDHVDSISEFEDGDYVRYDEAAARITQLVSDNKHLIELNTGLKMAGDAARTELAAARVNPDDIARIMRTHSTNDKDECIRILALRVDRLISQLPPAREDNPFNYREW